VPDAQLFTATQRWVTKGNDSVPTFTGDFCQQLVPWGSVKLQRINAIFPAILLRPEFWPGYFPRHFGVAANNINRRLNDNKKRRPRSNGPQMSKIRPTKGVAYLFGASL
jgi:hypothetical protein